jgi:DNA adenine methylase
MNSFMRWIGGKKLLRQQIVQRIPHHTTYVEVFGGAGWVLFHKDKSSCEIYNDITTDLTNLFMQVKHHPDALQQELQFMLPSRSLFKLVKANAWYTEIQRAARFYWLIRYSWGAKAETFNAAAKHDQPSLSNAITYLSNVAMRLDKVTIENVSFEKCIEKYDSTDTFFYLDPPYYKCQDYSFVGNKFTFEQHQKLADMLKSTKAKWLLSYNAAQPIIDLYAKHPGIAIEHVERCNNMSRNKGAYHELLIRNY